MLGHIESFNEQTQTGVIKYENAFYEFHLDQWTADTAPKAGDDVDFDHENEAVTEVSPVGAYLFETRPVKRRIVAGLLGILFGAVGLHRMYLGFWGMGIAQLVITFITGGFGVVWGFVDGVLMLTGHVNKDAKGRPLK